MKRSCVAFPKSDFGLTGGHGRVHRDQPARGEDDRDGDEEQDGWARGRAGELGAWASFT